LNELLGQELGALPEKAVPAMCPLLILTEEFGEVAETIDDLEAHKKSPIRHQHLITELSKARFQYTVPRSRN
jgi:NTP pyrophosphatase (non-canonical NTP hydrolase)